MTHCEYPAGYVVAHGQRDWQVVSDKCEGSLSLVGIQRVQRVAFQKGEGT